MFWIYTRRSVFCLCLALALFIAATICAVQEMPLHSFALAALMFACMLLAGVNNRLAARQSGEDLLEDLKRFRNRLEQSADSNRSNSPGQ